MEVLTYCCNMLFGSIKLLFTVLNFCRHKNQPLNLVLVVKDVIWLLLYEAITFSFLDTKTCI